MGRMLKEPTMVDLTENCSNGIPLELLDKPALIAYSKMLEGLVFRLQNSNSLSECKQWSTNDGEGTRENCSQESEKSIVSLDRYVPRPRKSHLRVCKYCSEVHKFGTKNCRAFNKRCQFCGKWNHVVEACWIKHRELYRPELGSFRKLPERKQNKDMTRSCSLVKSGDEERIAEEKVDYTDVSKHVDVEENACPEVSNKQFDGSKAEGIECSPVENKVCKKKRKSAKARGKKKLHINSSNKETHQGNRDIKLQKEADTNVGKEIENRSSQDVKISTDQVRNADVAHDIIKTSRGEENEGAKMRDDVDFIAADKTLPRTKKDTESGVKYDDHTKYILDEIAKAVATNDVGFWKSDYIRENIYLKGGIAKKQYDEMKKVHCPF